MLNLKIENQAPVQENFLGNGAIYHAFALMPDKDGRNYTEEEYQTEIERVGKMRLKLARSFYRWYAWDEETNTWNWENDHCKALYRWLEDMKKLGVTVALNTGWCSPGDINGTHWNGKSPFTVESDWEKSVENYGNWVSETVHQLIELRGFTNIKILTLFTEPTQKGAGTLPEGLTGHQAWLSAATAAAKALERDGRRHLVKLMGPNEAFTHTVPVAPMLTWLTKEHPDCVDIFSSHAYQYVKETAPNFLINGKNACQIIKPGGRIFQKVALTPNTDYTVNVFLAASIMNPLTVAGSVSFGAFEAGENTTINTGSASTNRLTTDSVYMIDSVKLTDKQTKYSLTFNSGDKEECFVGVYCDIKSNTGGGLYIGDMELIDKATGQQLILNREFDNDYKDWNRLAAYGTADAYYDWYRWCKNCVDKVPEDKLYIFDEYNTVYNINFAHDEHGANIVLDAIAYMNSGANGSLLWTAFDQQWPDNHTKTKNRFNDGVHCFGVMPYLKQSKIPYKAYYAFTLLSRYTGGENSKVFKGIGENHTYLSMNQMPDGNVTIVVVNNKDTADEFSVDFEKSLGLKFYRHCFNPETCIPDERAEVIPADKEFDIENTLTDSIAAYGVNVYTTYKD